MKTKTILSVLVSLMLFSNCVNKTKQPQEETLWNEKVEQTKVSATDTINKTKRVNTVDEDTVTYGFKELMEGKVKETPIFKDKPIEYFRKNNKYKDWDANNPKEVSLDYIVEKDGTTSNIRIIKSSGEKKLDDEAIRLIKEAPHLYGANLKGKPIRCKDTKITVFFPPK